MRVQTLKLGQKVVITELMSEDKGELQVGDIGTIVDNTRASPEADFPTRGLTSYWLSYRQIRKYKEPKHLELQVGDKVKIRNYKKYPELCVDSTRHYLSRMEQFIGSTYTVTFVHSDGSVRLDNDYAYCTPTLKRVKEPKPKEITVGSKVRVTSLIGADFDYGIRVEQEYTIIRHAVERNELYIIAPNGCERIMLRDQIELVS